VRVAAAFEGEGTGFPEEGAVVLKVEANLPDQ